MQEILDELEVGDALGEGRGKDPRQQQRKQASEVRFHPLFAAELAIAVNTDQALSTHDLQAILTPLLLLRNAR